MVHLYAVGVEQLLMMLKMDALDCVDDVCLSVCCIAGGLMDFFCDAHKHHDDLHVDQIYPALWSSKLEFCALLSVIITIDKEIE